MLPKLLFCFSIISIVASQISFGDDDEPQTARPRFGRPTTTTLRPTTRPPKVSRPQSVKTTKKAAVTMPTTTMPVTTTPSVIFEEESITEAELPPTTTKPPPTCLRNETYMASTRSCVGILTQGPCSNGSWVVIDNKTGEPGCVPRPSVCNAKSSEKHPRCAQAAVALREKLNPYQPKLICEATDGKNLAFTSSGEVVCICKTGHIYWKPDGRCYQILSRGPCAVGHYLILQKIKVTPPAILATTEAGVPVNGSTQGSRLRNMDEIDNTYLNPFNQRQALSTDDEAISVRNMDEFDNTVLNPYNRNLLYTRMQSTQQRPIDATETKYPREATVSAATTFQAIRLREMDEIDNTYLNPFNHKQPLSPTEAAVTAESTTTQTTPSTTRTKNKSAGRDTRRRFKRNMDEIDNVDFALFARRSPDKPRNNTTTEKPNEDEEYYTEAQCVPNVCPDDWIPVDLNRLAKSPNSNIPVATTPQPTTKAEDEDIFFFGNEDTTVLPSATIPATTSILPNLVCDKIGGQTYCNIDYALDVNSNNELECQGLHGKSSLDSVPLLSCPSGQRRDATGNCVRFVRFGG